MTMLRCVGKFAKSMFTISPRLLRMTVFAGCVFLATAMMAARSVRADVREVALGVGQQLSRLEDLTGGASTVRVNGLAMHRASTWTSQSQNEVLDRFEAYCKQYPTQLQRALGDVSAVLKDQASEDIRKLQSAFVIRNQQSGSGVLVCLVDRPRSSSVALVDWVRAMKAGEWFENMGRFCFVMVSPSQSQNGKMHVVTFWSDEGLQLNAMFPKAGDAPGSDSGIWSRPKGSRRVLSASVDGYPGSVRVYESPSRKAEAMGEFERTLSESGLRRVDLKSGSEAMIYQRSDGTFIVVDISARENGSSVSVVESPSSGVADITAKWSESL